MDFFLRTAELVEGRPLTHQPPNGKTDLYSTQSTKEPIKRIPPKPIPVISDTQMNALSETEENDPSPSTSSRRSSKSQTERWFEGGTLHKSTATQWKQVTRKNRLATCGDFATHWYNTQGIQPKINGSSKG